MAVIPEGPAPYTPTSTVVTLMDGYRDRGYATPFTKDVLLRVGITDSLIHRTLQALRLLDLIDEYGEPTETFRKLKAIRGEDEYKAALKDWLYEVYADVLQYADPTKDPTTRVTEAFRGYTPEGQRSRMVTLMLGLFEYAGLIEPGPEGSSPRRSSSPKPRSGGQRKPAATSPRERLDQFAGGSTKLTPINKQTGLPPELLGLLQSMPPDRCWTQKRRDVFVAAFTTVLDYSIAIVPESEGEP